MHKTKYCGGCGLVKQETEFHKSSSQCKDCACARSRAWLAANKERAAIRKKEYRLQNKERIAAQVAAYFKANSAAILSNIKKWQQKNKERVAVFKAKYRQEKRDYYVQKCAERRAIKLRAKPEWANDFFISEAYALAALRTKLLGFSWHVDHIVPLRSKKVCGFHVHNNLRVIPALENIRKKNYHWPEMA